MENNVSPDDLAVFLSVLGEGGFRAAARRLGVAPSKVSTTVSRIEAQLGVPLLLRTTRSVRATEQGRALANRITPLLADVRAACEETASSTGRMKGRLRLSVPGAVVPDILPPLVAELLRRHPDVEVDLVVENALVDIVATGCDAGIRYAELLDRDMVSIPIGPRTQQTALAASPAYLEAHGQPRTPAELTHHYAIRYRLPGGPLLPWVLRKRTETLEVEPITRLVLTVNASSTGLSYARAGLGIIGAFRNWLEDDFRAGTLVPLLSDWWPDRDGPRLYYPSRSSPAPLRAFIDICRSMG